MKKIEDLKTLDLKKIDNDSLNGAIEEILEAYRIAEDKKAFEKEEQGNIDKLFGFVQKLYPDAIIEQKKTVKMNDGFKFKLLSKEAAIKRFNEGKEVYGLNTADDSESLMKNIEDFEDFDEFGMEDASEKKKPKNDQKPTPKLSAEEKEKILEELEALKPHLENCRAEIKAFNAKKRAAEGEKPKPTRLRKIKGHFVSIANLIPDNLKSDINVQRETKKIILSAQRSILKNFEMDKLKSVKKVEKEIEEKFDNIEEKLDKDE